MVVVVDSPDRENEGDLCMAAEYVTAEAINFMAKHAPRPDLPGARARPLRRARPDPMATHNEAPLRTAFTVSVEARDGRLDRHLGRRPRPHDQGRDRPRDEARRPGPAGPRLPAARARGYGVLERMGQTEASVDLARLAGLTPAGVICEIMNDDGTMARVPDLAAYCAQHGLKMITVADLIAYRRRTERLVERIAIADMPTKYGDVLGLRLPVGDRRPAACRARLRRRRRRRRTCSSASTRSA